MAIPWYAYAVGSALLATAFSIIRKKALLKDHAMSFESARTLSVALLSLFLIPFINFNFDKRILLLIYGISLLSTIGILFAAKALRHEAISLITPLGNIRPAFVAIIAFIFLKESLGLKEVIGIGILLVAAYLLESDHQFSDFFAPIKHLMRDKYSKYFLFATFIFGICSVIDRYILITHLDIFTYFFLIWIFLAFNFNIIHTLKYGFKDTLNCFKELTYLPLLVGFLSMAMNLLSLKALSMAYASFVAPVLLLSTLFVVLVGGEYFHEKYLLFRIGASALMLVGAYLIII